jgi:uncharacterized protein (TIGR02996 family)
VTTDVDLLSGVYSAPDDDMPRLAYATHIEERNPERAEFIRLQVLRAQDERKLRVPFGSPSAREMELLEKNYEKWGHYIQRYLRDPIVPQRFDHGWQFDRGFISFVRLEPENFLALGQRLFDMAPVQHADLYGGSEPVRPLFQSPYLARLDSLSLWKCGLDDDDAVALANCEGLQRATWIDLSENRIGKRGIEALAASPIFANKVVVDLHGNPYDPSERAKYDWDGSLAFAYMPEEAQAIEQKLGRPVLWFHCATREPMPDRFHVKWAGRPAH